jgi:hypothetical protein
MAMLRAACVGALAGTVGLAALFTVAMLPTVEYSVVHMSMWHSPPSSPAEINAIVASVAARTFAVLLIFSFVIAAPVSTVVVLCAYPLLQELRTAGRIASGIVGFLAAALVWAYIGLSIPPIHFGTWMSWFIVVGVAAGLASAWRLSRQR